MILVMKQPDLGTSLTYFPILIAGVFLAGVRWQYIAVVVLSLALALPVAWHFLQDYQRARLTSFLDPSQDPQGQRVSGDSVDDRCRSRRDVGPGRDPRNADATSVSARAAH